MLVEKLSQISQKLSFLKPVSIIFSVGCFVFIVYGFLFTSPTEHNSHVNSASDSLILFAFIWSILFTLFITVFKSIPKKNNENKKVSLIMRMKLSFMHFFYFSFSVFFIGLTAIILLLTIRMIRVWFST
jgi:uncharacterized membrane protein